MPTDVLRLLDTTLRDGMSASGFAPGDTERHAIVRALAGCGLDAVELASSDAADVETVRSLAAEASPAAACVIGPALSDAVADALVLLGDAPRRRIHLYADVFRPGTLAPALEAIFAARVNVEEVEFSPLRAFEQPWNTVAEVAVACADSGATIVNLSDTRGTAAPAEVRALVAAVAGRVDERSTLVSFHGHDHAGRAVANSLAACAAGARQLHVCVGGLGPRGGNTDLAALLAALDASPEAPARPRIDPDALELLSGLVSAARR